jgi:hypothetical protein
MIKEEIDDGNMKCLSSAYCLYKNEDFKRYILDALPYDDTKKIDTFMDNCELISARDLLNHMVISLFSRDIEMYLHLFERNTSNLNIHIFVRFILDAKYERGNEYAEEIAMNVFNSQKFIIQSGDEHSLLNINNIFPQINRSMIQMLIKTSGLIEVIKNIIMYASDVVELIEIIKPLMNDKIIDEIFDYVKDVFLQLYLKRRTINNILSLFENEYRDELIILLKNKQG